ncbi:MAG TPA: hypothetical protein VKE88_02325 [Candidatus Nanoarchaeia archaeon]|nr:hypothetical protein [Candidatus Nanoarchaeia archaeon]
MAIKFPQPIRSKLEALVDNGFNFLGQTFFSWNYHQNVENMMERAMIHLDILEDGKRLARYEREKNEAYMKLRKHYEGNHCPPGVKDKWLDQEDRMRYLDIRLKISLAMDDSWYIYDDRSNF